jgi:hypothetical protein
MLADGVSLLPYQGQSLQLIIIIIIIIIIINSKGDTSNKGNWNHLKIVQTLPRQHTGKARNQGTTENSHIGHCARTSESTNVKLQSIFNTLNNITCNTNSKYTTAATLYTTEAWIISGCNCKYPSQR